jgi:hypothetical protein
MRQAAGGDRAPPPVATDDGTLEREGAAQRHEIYRVVNANIVALLDRFDAGLRESESRVEIYCECGRRECTETVNLWRDEYERARAVATHFIAATGHALPNVERVVQDNGRYMIVELVSET